MPRFLIEVPHKAEKAACMKAAKIFHEKGSHFLVNADWGCSDDVHKAWIIVDVDDRDTAKFVVPSPYREKAEIVELQKFKFTNLDEGIEHHKD